MEEITKISALEVKSEIQHKAYKNLQNEFENLKVENKLLKEQILTQESYSRKKNIKIFGLKTQNNQGLEDSIIRTMAKVGITLGPRDIERVHYITQDRREDSRPVIVQLLHWKDKQSIMSKKDNLRRENIYIQEDYPKVIAERRRMLLPIFFKAIEMYPELHPKLYVDKINLGGKVYTVDNIDAIQYPDLLPERVFTPTKSGIQAFYTKYSPLSNHYQASFEAEGKLFSTSEQYFMYKKALHFEDKDIAQRIMETTNPVTIKQLGKKVQGFQKNEWYRVLPEYMYQAMHAKFSQNEELKGFLLSTGGNKLIEASATDKFWGVGLPLRSGDLFNDKKWTGKNMAGETLERVRQSLKH